jgi:hypothetical protein
MSVIKLKFRYFETKKSAPKFELKKLGILLCYLDFKRENNQGHEKMH